MAGRSDQRAAIVAQLVDQIKQGVLLVIVESFAIVDQVEATVSGSNEFQL